MGLDNAWGKILEDKGLIDAPPAIGSKPAPETIILPKSLPPARIRLDVWIPGLKTQSEANTGGKYQTKFGRKKLQHGFVLAALPDVLIAFHLPTPVKLIRVGGKRLDDDNLQFAFKAIRDAVAEWLRVDDGDTSSVRFRYDQRPGYVAGVRIVIG
jgi:hypothetical protein